jgi:radical SAM superfamily enzyme YgiQ (UPF0313 family)
MLIVLSHVGIRNIGFDAFERHFTPTFDGLDTYIIPYGLTLIGGALREAGHGVEYLDLRLVSGWEEVEARLREMKPGLLGVGFQTPNREFAVELARLAKSLGIPTVAGGPHVTCAPYDGLAIREFDHVVIGEGEEAMVDIAAAYEDGRTPPHEIHPEPLRDIENRPLPYLSETYEAIARRKNCGFVVTSRGCPGRCKYCQPVQKALYGPRIKMRSAASILAEMDRYLAMGIRKFFIMDDMFVVNRNRVAEFAGSIKERGLDVEYDISARVDFFDQEMADHLASTGCNLISFGFESGSDHKLKLMHKQTTREMNLTAGRIWKKTGKLTLANILVGIPGETDEDIAQDLSFIEELGPSAFYYNWMVPFPGTHYFEELKAAGQLLTTDFDQYEMNIVRKMPLIKTVDYDRVRRWEKEFDRLRNDSAQARFDHGLALSRAGQDAEAEAEFRRAIKMDPDFPYPRYDLGVVLKRTGRRNEARAEFAKAAELNPTFPWPVFDLGLLHLEDGEAAEALSWFERACELDPNFPFFHFRRGEALAALGRAGEARQAFERALELKPGEERFLQGLEGLGQEGQTIPERTSSHV